MIRHALLAVALLLAAQASRAQEARHRFDPVVYLGTLNIYQQWAEGVFLKPPHSVQQYVDTLLSYENVIAFTLVTRDSSRAGWTMRMDFDADNYGALKLIRVKAWKPAGTDAAAEFKDLASRVQSILKRKLLERTEDSADKIVWKWMPRSGHAFVITRQAAEGARPAMLRMSLDAVVQ
ncbi:MAG: hypothetical protein IPP94_19950 [Ignavibacteria bacterium]|nr:hypothetical protein [Ignavibacteria bacterium]